MQLINSLAMWYIRDNYRSDYLEPEEEGKVFTDCKAIKQDVVLRTDSQALANLIHVSEDTVSVDGSRTTGGRVQT